MAFKKGSFLVERVEHKSSFEGIKSCRYLRDHLWNYLVYERPSNSLFVTNATLNFTELIF